MFVNNIDFSQERRVDFQVFGDYVEVEEVFVNFRFRYGQAVYILVFFRSFSEEILEVCFLGGRSEVVKSSFDF